MIPVFHKTLPLLGGALLLAGCASANMEALTMTPPSAQIAPSSLHVAVAMAPNLSADADATRIAHRLQSDIVQRYRKVGLQAFAANGTLTGVDSATVRVEIRRADPGDAAARMLVGFGAGRSSLTTHTTFELTGQAGSAMSFSASAKGSRKPGLILPGAIAGATGELTGLAVGAGVGLLSEARGSLGKESDRSAKLIVEQTRALYRSAGWQWPSDNTVSSSAREPA